MNFSILMSLYNSENEFFFDESLNSILNQTVLPSEIVLVKDGYINERLESVITKFESKNKSELIIVDLKENVGLGQALNRGLEHCTNEIVFRVDTDDISVKDRFEKQITYLKNNSNVDVLGSWVEEFDSKIGDLSNIKNVPSDNESIYKYSLKRNPINHMAVVFKKSKVIEAGGYEHCLWHEDYYLWMKMINKKMKFYNIPEVLVYARVNGLEMHKRRGGWKYLKTELDFQKKIVSIGVIKKNKAIINLLLKSIIILAPVKLRSVFYNRYLRNMPEKR